MREVQNMPNAAEPKGGGHHGRPGGRVKGSRLAAAPRAGFGPIVTALIAAVLLAGLAGVLVRTNRPSLDPSARPPAIGGPFTMRDQHGRSVDARLLLGHWSAVFFGYVSCPDTCPATLQTLQAVQGRLTPREANRFQVVFVTVDPKRDTSATLAAYLAQPAFPRGAIGLVGTPAQTAAMARAYRVYYATPANPAGGYDVDHSAAIYLMDPRGRFAAALDEAAGPDGVLAQLRTTMTRS